MNSKLADELHDLQPLFERGLWVFGPEYEGIQFFRTGDLPQLSVSCWEELSKKFRRSVRILVALPESSIGVYGAPEYASENNEVSGLRKVLLVELKKGGFELTQKEVDQARDYAKELTKGGEVGPETKIIGYVLGASLESGLERTRHGDRIEIIPFAYNTFLERAHSRTFNLQRKIEQAGFPIPKDAVMDELFAQSDIEFE